jgi:hypothetical protein
MGVLKPGEDVVWIEVPFPNLSGGLEEFEDPTTIVGVKNCVNDSLLRGLERQQHPACGQQEVLGGEPGRTSRCSRMRTTRRISCATLRSESVH